MITSIPAACFGRNKPTGNADVEDVFERTLRMTVRAGKQITVRVVNSGRNLFVNLFSRGVTVLGVGFYVPAGGGSRG